MVVHEHLREAREASAEGLAWLDRLPGLVAEACRRWGLEIVGTPYDGGVCGWVAPVRQAGGDAVLKVTWPHPEAATEAAALRWWDGAGAVRLIGEDSEAWVMLLERCLPGTPLRDAGLPTERGLAIGTELLSALWGKGLPPDEDSPFESMLQICGGWADIADRRVEEYGAALRALGTDPGILNLGVELLRTLPGSAERRVLVHGDFNPGNVLAAGRMPYLAIDPKPMVGDPAYDPWSLVAQLDWPFRLTDAARVVPQRIRRLAESLDLAPERIAAWGVARDVEGGLWAASEGNVADGAKWIRSATVVAPMLG
jgi:streptomycin 6-kinase